MAARVAVVLGATGLVGTELVRGLAGHQEVARIVALVRRASGSSRGLPAEQTAKVAEVVVDYDRLEASADAFNGANEVYCALGTTIRDAGSQERFRLVDHDYPLRAARIALSLGARHFLLVSAAGADPRSRIFYSRVKGELEHDLGLLGYQRLTVVRPSLLLGERREFRLWERAATLVGGLFPRKWAPVRASDVAAALIASVDRAGTRVSVIESGSIPRPRQT